MNTPSTMKPMVFLLSLNEGVLFDPMGKFHGWLMRRHPDGLWISVRKLEAVDPEDHPLIRAMSGLPPTSIIGTDTPPPSAEPDTVSEEEER